MKVHERIIQDSFGQSQKTKTPKGEENFQQIFEKILSQKTSPVTDILEISPSGEDFEKAEKLTEEIFSLLEKLIAGDKSTIEALEKKALELKTHANLFSPSMRESLEQISLLAMVYLTKAREGLL
ncbi:hypothetical protein [Thermodesulfatator atlanticus]|uniref:hypothetical protein n=1 Tax=Thermodesulfatator atlanticus TaxID=501497 RepID=UPI0003B71C7B|nr:hypothetical protein [Thermodesulfatator atlanticus]